MNFTLNMADVERISKGLVKFAEGKALKIAANVVKEQEVRQTEVGRDYKGQFFAPYKRNYPEWGKTKSSRVNLYRTGALRNSRYYDSTSKELLYGYLEEPIAEYLQNGTPNMEAREFVGVSKLDIPNIEAAIVRGLNESAAL